MDYITLMSCLLYGITIGAAYALVASGLSIILGVMGVLNFTHGSLVMLGAYVGLTFVNMTGNFWLSLLLAPLVVALVGGLIETSMIRRLYGKDILLTLLLTFGLSMVFSNAVLIIWGGDQYSIKLPSYFNGFIKIFGVYYPKFRLFVLIFSCLLVIILSILLNRSRWGLVIRAGMFNLEIVEAFGINIHRVFNLLFVFCSWLAAVAGVIIGAMRSLNHLMDVEFITMALVVIVIGGLGSFKGALIGSLILGLAQSFGGTLIPGFAKYVTWTLMVIILLLRPEGLLQEK
jgi:branched-subunit amino acid ABC-type transport system permease component